jgi:hypothetical protein
MSKNNIKHFNNPHLTFTNHFLSNNNLVNNKLDTHEHFDDKLNNNEVVNNYFSNDDFINDIVDNIKPIKTSKINKTTNFTEFNNSEVLIENIVTDIDKDLIINDTNEHLENINIVEKKHILPMKSNDFLKELLLKQLPNVNPTKKLTYSDMKRISKFLVTSIFDENNCSIWNGYITNEKKQTKGIYINFYFNQKKIALHRLLYLNFIGNILNTEYIKFTCTNKGKCCNIHHMKKYIYNSLPINDNIINNDIINSNNNSVHIVQSKNNLTIEL